jgi:hypothetical protein
LPRNVTEFGIISDDKNWLLAKHSLPSDVTEFGTISDD